MIGLGRVDLFGVPVDALTMDETVDRIRSWVAAGGPRQHVVLNAAKVVELERSPALADVIRRCDLVSPWSGPAGCSAVPCRSGSAAST
jgi:N-acetylglucosaminyldiphosphoundecaprenol N-acetyl-beta-D-mannosaminyltransferase